VAKILIIDDDESLRTSVSVVLRGEGHEVHESAGGANVIDIAKSGNLDVIITDILMPDVDGFELIGRLRKELPTVKILAISGGGRNKPGSYLSIAEKLGADFSLCKPFTKAELTAALDFLLKKV
jgi:DNA-binding response OmpR family regulator